MINTFRFSSIGFLSFLLLCYACKPQQKSNFNDVLALYEAKQKELKSESHWPDFSAEVLINEKNGLIAILEEVQKFNLDELSEEDRINADILDLILNNDLSNLNFRTHEFPLNAEGGFLTNIIFSISGTQLKSEEQKNKYIDKLKALPEYLQQRQGHMEAGMARGALSPKLITELCIGMIDDLLNQPVDQSFLMKPTYGTDLDSTVLKIVKNEVIPAYQEFREFLIEKYLPAAPEAIGASAVTDGKAYYEQRTRYFSTDTILPQQVFDLGMSEVRRIRLEMDEILKELDYKGDFVSFQEYLRTNPQFYAKTPSEILEKAAWITKEMEGELPRYFGKLPRMPLTVKPVPAAIAPNYTSGRYSQGSYEHHRAGQYWVNTTKLESRPLYALPALSLHEGVPGHHTQIMLAAELEMPDFRRNTYLSAFGEGWALYCEYLGKEAGIYHTPYEDFGRLVYEMWRACRLVVDPGMHYFGWSRDEAFNFMKDNTALSIHEITTEIDRYIGWPGQAISYKLGELKIKELRKYAESELGDQFDIRAFHDKVLANGSIPLTTLDRIIRNWVDEGRLQHKAKSIE